MRATIGGIMEKANTFCAITATTDDCAPHSCHGEQIISTRAGTCQAAGGLRDVAGPESMSALSTYFFYFDKAISSCPTTWHTSEALNRGVAEVLSTVFPVDRVFLALYLAMAVEGVLADTTRGNRHQGEGRAYNNMPDVIAFVDERECMRNRRLEPYHTSD